MTTILIARPEAQARQTADRLTARGFEAIISPALVITAVGATVPDGAFDGIIVTSANAMPWLAAQGALDRSKPVFAVGRKTAAAAQAAGFTNVRTAEGDRTALDALVRGALKPGSRLLAPVGRDHHAETLQGFRSDGYTVESPIVYAANIAERLSTEVESALRYDVADAVLHYSARSAKAFFDLLERAGFLQHGQKLKHVCLSQQVADALPADAQANAIVAARADDDAMIDAVVHAFDPAAASAESRPPGKSRKARPRAFPLDAKADGVVETASVKNAEPAIEASKAQEKPVAVVSGSTSTGRENPAFDTQAQASAPATEKERDDAMAQARQADPEHRIAVADTPDNNRPNATPKRQRMWPAVAAAGLTGGLIGAAATLLLPALLPGGWLPAKKEPDVAAVVAGQVKAQMDARIGALPAKSDIDGLQKGLATETAQRTQALAGLQTSLADLTRRVNETAQLARAAPDQAAAAQRAVADIAKRVDLLDGVAKVPYDIVGLSKRVDDIAARKPDAPPDLTPLDRQLAAANAAIAALRGQVEALAAKPVPDTGRPMRLHALATAIATALQRGAPFKTELEAATAAGADSAVIQPLAIYAAQGAPTGQALAKTFEPLAAKMLAALEPPPPANPGLVDRMRMMATSMVKVRPVGQNAGDSPAGRIAQIEAALGRGQFADAVKNWLALPDAAKAAGGAFGTALQARADAEAASRVFLEQSTRALARQGQ